MMPFNQNEAGMTKSALTLSPLDGQTYSAPIQQAPLREKLSEAIVFSNLLIIGAHHAI